MPEHGYQYCRCMLWLTLFIQWHRTFLALGILEQCPGRLKLAPGFSIIDTDSGGFAPNPIHFEAYVSYFDPGITVR